VADSETIFEGHLEIETPAGSFHFSPLPSGQPAIWLSGFRVPLLLLRQRLRIKNSNLLTGFPLNLKVAVFWFKRPVATFLTGENTLRWSPLKFLRKPDLSN